jgi:large subunit ribosomal protein L31
MERLNLNLAEIIERRSAFTLRDNMKEKIHPKFFSDSHVVCSCGNTFTTGSTKKELRVELCSKCHPFFTGERRMMDTAGRVERFNQRYKITKATK